MNPHLAELQPYPFERLATLKQDLQPPQALSPISLSIGEPQHAPPSFVAEIINNNLSGLSRYPLTQGSSELRQAIAAWLVRRFSLNAANLDIDRHILPVNGTREALFSFAQCLVEPGADSLVLMPNPF